MLPGTNHVVGAPEDCITLTGRFYHTGALRDTLRALVWDRYASRWTVGGRPSAPGLLFRLVPYLYDMATRQPDAHGLPGEQNRLGGCCTVLRCDACALTLLPVAGQWPDNKDVAALMLIVFHADQLGTQHPTGERASAFVADHICAMNLMERLVDRLDPSTRSAIKAEVVELSELLLSQLAAEMNRIAQAAAAHQTGREGGWRSGGGRGVAARPLSITRRPSSGGDSIGGEAPEGNDRPPPDFLRRLGTPTQSLGSL